MAASTAKAGEVADPLGVVTWIAPELALPGTTASISVVLATEKENAARPLNDTEVAPLRKAPVITTAVPGLPWLGLTPLMVGTSEGGGGVDDPPPPPQATIVRNRAKVKHRIGDMFMVAPENSSHESQRSMDPGTLE
jgi:hypothetical protein